MTQQSRRTSPKRRPNRRKKLLRRYTALFLASFVACLGCVGVSVRILLEELENTATNRSVLSLMHSGAQAEGVEEGAVLLNDAAPSGSMNSDFTELYATNGDLVGWIKAGAEIDLAVVQGTDNQHYLTTDFYGESNSAGSIFMDAENVISPADDHLVIYGHNMKSGSMFGTLPSYRTLSYLKQYPTLQFRTIYESAAQADCVPFAIFDASMVAGDSNYFDIRRFNFETDADKQAFIDELKSRSIFDIPVEVTAEDPLISLVTCSYSNDDGRFILAMRKVRSGEDVQTLAAQVQQATAK